MKTGMNSFWDDLCGNEMSFRYHVNKYELRNTEMEQTHFRMKVILVSCEQPLRTRTNLLYKCTNSLLVIIL